MGKRNEHTSGSDSRHGLAISGARVGNVAIRNQQPRPPRLREGRLDGTWLALSRSNGQVPLFENAVQLGTVAGRECFVRYAEFQQGVGAKIKHPAAPRLQGVPKTLRIKRELVLHEAKQDSVEPETANNNMLGKDALRTRGRRVFKTSRG